MLPPPSCWVNLIARYQDFPATCNVIQRGFGFLHLVRRAGLYVGKRRKTCVH